MLNALIGWLNPQPAKNINAKKKVLDLILNEPISITGLQINTDAANTLKTKLVQAADSNRQKIINTLLEFIAPEDGNDMEFDNQRVLKFMMLFALDQNMSYELLDEDYKNIIKYAALCGNFEAIRMMSQLNFFDTPNGFARVINNIELLKECAEESHEHAVYTMLRGGALLPSISQSEGMRCTEMLKERLMYFYKEAWLCSKSFEDKDAPFNKDDMHTVFQIYYFSKQIKEAFLHSSSDVSYYSDLTKDDKLVCDLLQNGHPSENYKTKFTMGNIYDPKVIIKKQAALKQGIEKYEAIRKEFEEAEQATGWIAAAKKQAIIVKHAIMDGMISAHAAEKQKNILLNLHNTLKGFTFAGVKEADDMTKFVIRKAWSAELNAMLEGMDLVAPAQRAIPAQEEIDNTPDDLFKSLNPAGNEEDFSSSSDEEYQDLSDDEEFEVSAQASVSSSDEGEIEYSYSEEDANQVEQEHLRDADPVAAVAQPAQSYDKGNAPAASEEESVSDDDEYGVSTSEEEHSADQVEQEQEHVPTPEEVAAPAVELPGNILSRHPLATAFAALALCAAAGIAFSSHKMGEGSMKVGLSALGNVVTNWFKNNLPDDVANRLPAAFKR